MIERRLLGATGIELPTIGLGTWMMEQDDRASVVRAIHRALELGMTHIDTAEMYGSGRVEQLLAEALAGRRDAVHLVSKVLPSNASYAGTLRACEASLQRLRTDRLDLYLLHWPGQHPLEETVRAFRRLIADGKIRAWGVSNFDVDDLERLVALAGDGEVACDQVLYHLQERTIEERLLPWCAARGIAVVGYSPFGSGAFPAPASRGGRVLEEVARAHDSTPRQVALRFLLRHGATFTIPKSSVAAHVEENAGAAAVALSDGELRQIAEAFPAAPKSGLPMI